MEVPGTNGVTTIHELFSGKNVFVTGGSGFIGKVLLEKLLRSCPGIGNVYMLLREKKGKSLPERMDKIFNQKMFGPLKEKDPQILKKLVPIGGDAAKIGLGLSDEDRKLLINEVNIVIHAAASIRFTDHLKTAVFQNLRGTREVILLVDQLKEVTIFVHVSTAYTNCHLGHVEERLYPAQMSWRDIIRLAEEADESVLQSLTDKFIGKLPNTYMFTKSLAEHAVNDMCKGKFPTIIMRPSLVMSAMEEPLPGWIDNLNGPYAAYLGYGTGVLKICYADKYVKHDHVSVDNFVKSLIMAAWLKVVDKEHAMEVTIYNCCSEFLVSIADYNRLGIHSIDRYPFEKKIWARSSAVPLTVNLYYYFTCFILFHLLPACFLDGMLKLLGRKPMMLKIQRLVYLSNISFSYFMTREITFETKNFAQLPRHLSEKDEQQFSYVKKSIEAYSDVIVCGIKQYILNESLSISPRTLRIHKGLIILDKVVKAAWYIFVIYILYSSHHVHYILEEFSNYIINVGLTACHSIQHLLWIS